MTSFLEVEFTRNFGDNMGVKDELSKLVHPSCLGVAFAGQSVAILSVTAATWTLMYLYSPSKSLRMRFPSLNNAYMRVEFFIQNRIVDPLPASMRNSKVIDWNRFVTSGAEAWILRKPLIPFTYAGSVAFGVFCGTKFYDWKYAGNDPMTPYRREVSTGEVEVEQDGDVVFGWNKIERAPSTDGWESRQ